MTGKKRFNEYLEDAERLFLEVHSNDVNGKINVVGYSIIERLNRLTEINSISEDLVNNNNCIKSSKALKLSFWMSVFLQSNLLNRYGRKKMYAKSDFHLNFKGLQITITHFLQNTS